MKHVLLSLFGLAISSVSFAADQPVQAEGFSYVRTVGGIAEYKLDANGLRVLMMPLKGAPVATFMVTYHVGSRNEVTGTTGATHLLEHLMFKGTTKFDRSLGTGYDQIMERVGAEINATTWNDRTNYFATVQSGGLGQLIELEADRMRNLSLREEDRRPEMTVVRNEFERGENNPMNALEKEMWASAFMAHPYHHDTIGWRSDIELVPIEKLRAFYDTFYWPDNATATVIGDFDAAKTLADIRKYYGAIPKSPHPFPAMYTKEPEQTGQRRVMVKRSGELGVVMLAHKIPAATHADYPAVQVFSNILTNGKSSRCYRALTDKSLTNEVSSVPSFNHDMTLHLTYAVLDGAAKHADVEQKLTEEIESIRAKGVTDAEVKAAIGNLLAKRSFERDGSFEQAAAINECIAVGDWTLFVTLDDKIKAVTPADVQRVAKAYFKESRSVAGWFVPTAEASDEPAQVEEGKKETFEPKKHLSPKPLEKALAPAAPTDFAERIVREQVASVDLMVCKTAAKDIAHIQGSLPAGEAASSNRALAHLASGMIQRGTTKHDQFAIADMLDKVGAEIEFKVTSDTLDFSAKCLAKDVPMVVSLLAEQFRTPLLAADEFTKEQKQLSSSLQQSLEQTDVQAAVAFSQAVYPQGHPSRKMSIQDLIATVGKTTVDDVKAFHAANYGPTGLHLVIIGDVDAQTIKSEVGKAFDGWKAQPVKTIAAVAPSKAGGEAVVKMKDKASVSLVIGQSSGVSVRDPDWLAVYLATQGLGSGFTSRLVANVRDREGLTYSIRALMRDDAMRAGSWQASGSFAPALLAKGLASTRREIEHWWKDGISAEELEFRKTSIAGEFAVSLETTEGMAKQVLLCAQRGFDMKWLDEYPAKLQALTLKDVNDAIRKHLDPKTMVTVKAGTLP